METNCPLPSPSDRQLLQKPDGVPEETQDEKTEDTGPRELRCISKG